MNASTRLQAEISALQKTAMVAAKNPFLPAPARDAIAQAVYCIEVLASEVLALREQNYANRETVNGQLGEMRQALARHNAGGVL